VDTPIEKGDGAPAWVQVTPTEMVLKPGQAVKLHARLFDAKGRFLREEPAMWSLQGLKGTVTDGNLVVAADPIEQAGTIKATIGAVSGEARAHVVHPLPWTETFESYADAAVPPGWINAVAGKYSVVTLDGQKVLQKAPDESIFQRGRIFMGPVDRELHDRGRRPRGDENGGRWAISGSPRSAIRSCSTATIRS
jgi:hypothetical protein